MQLEVAESPPSPLNVAGYVGGENRGAKLRLLCVVARVRQLSGGRARSAAALRVLSSW